MSPNGQSVTILKDVLGLIPQKVKSQRNWICRWWTHDDDVLWLNHGDDDQLIDVWWLNLYVMASELRIVMRCSIIWILRFMPQV